MIQTPPTSARGGTRTHDQSLFDLERYAQRHRERQSRRTEEFLNAFRATGVVALACLWAAGLLAIDAPQWFGPTLTFAALYSGVTALVVRAPRLLVRRWLVPVTATLDLVLVSILCATSGGFDSGLLTIYFLLVATAAYRFRPRAAGAYSLLAFLSCGLHAFSTAPAELGRFAVVWSMLGLMAVLAVMVSRALANARRVSEKAQRGALALAHLGANLSSCADVASVCRAAVGDLSLVLGVEDVALALRDRSGLRVLVGSGRRGVRSIGAVLSTQESLHPAARAMNAKQAVRAAQTTSEMLAVPVAGDDECSGAVIAWGGAHHPVDDSRIEMALSAGRIVGVALERAADYEHVRARSELDPLTGLFNRAALERRVAELEAAGTPYALAVLDLDTFKHYNDAYGHATGDLVLMAVADHLRTWLRSTDIVARIGGDEFVVVLPSLGGDEAETILRRLGGSVTGLWGAVRFSCGVAASPAHGTGLQHLMAEADATMYQLKKQGGGGVRVSATADRN